DHGAGAGGGHEGLPQIGPGERGLHPGHDQRAQHADRRRLGRAGDAGIHRADDHRHEEDHGAQLDQAAQAIAPRAAAPGIGPDAAASVGLAMPAYIEPMIIAMRKTTGPSSIRPRRRSPQVKLSSASGVTPRRIVAYRPSQNMNSAASRKPGTMPAMNSLMIETSASTP